MNLSKKLLLFLITQAFLFTIAITSFVYYYIYPTYIVLEKNLLESSMEQITHSLKNEAEQFQQFATRWSIWDELADYVQTKDQQFVLENFAVDQLKNSHLNAAAIFTPNGQIIMHNDDNQIDSNVLLSKLLKNNTSLPLSIMHIDHLVTREDQGNSGFYVLGNKVILVDINPIYPTLPAGDPQGYILFARTMTTDALSKLHQTTGSDFTLTSISAIAPRIQQQLKDSKSNVVSDSTSTDIYAYTLFPDLNGENNIVISLKMERKLFKRAQENTQIFIFIGIGVGIVFILNALLFMQFIILKPIHTLRRQMDLIIKSKIFKPIAQISQTKDEFSDLTQHFNSLIEHVIEQNKALEDLSLTDPLTSLQNRRSLDQFVTTQGGFLKRERKPLSVIMIDIDHFKLYNDTYGHVQGDAIIIKVAQAILQNTNRSSDFIARYGGEEFIIILPDTPIEGAEIIANNIRNEIAKMHIPHAGSTTAPFVTVSIGVSYALLKDKIQIFQLIEKADNALYDAKAQGRNTVVLNESRE